MIIPDRQSIPILSEGVQISKTSESEEYVLSNKYGHYLKISKEVYLLIYEIDNKSTIEKITDNFNKKYNEKITTDFFIFLFYEKLSKYGIIKGINNPIKKIGKPSYLKLSFIIIPSHIVSKIIPYLRFLFRRNLFFGSFIISFGVLSFFLIDNFNEFVKYEFSSSDMLLFIILSFFSVIFHEFGHATSTEFYNAKHKGIGGGFYLFTPVLFADVTDIWRLPPQKRIIINLAGIYFDFIYCFFLIIVYIFLKNESILYTSLSLFVLTTFNLNPLLRDDGYWVLSDYLGVSNLRDNSNKKLKKVIKGNINYSLNKIDYILIIYAILSWLAVIIFVSYVLIFDINSLLYLPFNLYEYIHDIIYEDSSFSITKLVSFSIPIIFYIMVFNFIRGYKRN